MSKAKIDKDKWRYQGGIYDYATLDEYPHYFICCNCEEKVYVWIKKGTLISEISDKVVCDNCGCIV